MAVLGVDQKAVRKVESRAVREQLIGVCVWHALKLEGLVLRIHYRNALAARPPRDVRPDAELPFLIEPAAPLRTNLAAEWLHRLAERHRDEVLEDLVHVEDESRRDERTLRRVDRRCTKDELGQPERGSVPLVEAREWRRADFARAL